MSLLHLPNRRMVLVNTIMRISAIVFTAWREMVITSDLVKPTLGPGAWMIVHMEAVILFPRVICFHTL